MADDTAPPLPNEVFIGSHLKASNTYGRNGDPSASSDLPGKHTHTDPSTKVAPPQVVVVASTQTRTISDKPIAAHAGMSGAAKGPTIPSKLDFGNK